MKSKLFLILAIYMLTLSALAGAESLSLTTRERVNEFLNYYDNGLDDLDRVLTKMELSLRDFRMLDGANKYDQLDVCRAALAADIAELNAILVQPASTGFHYLKYSGGPVPFLTFGPASDLEASMAFRIPDRLLDRSLSSEIDRVVTELTPTNAATSIPDLQRLVSYYKTNIALDLPPNLAFRASLYPILNAIFRK